MCVSTAEEAFVVFVEGTVGTPSVDHSHGILFNSGNAGASVNSSINGANSNLSVNAIGGPGINPWFPSLGLGLALNGFNSNIGINTGNSNIGITAGNTNTSLNTGNADTHTHSGSVFTAGDASTINASTLAHTHTTATTQIIFIIKIS